MKKKIQVFQKKKYWDWERYRKSLYHDFPAKKPLQEKIVNFLFKIGVVFVAAFFTTLTFNLLLRPNGIYNSGLNGFFQSILNLITGYSESVRAHYGLFLFGTAFLVNSAIIFILCNWFGGKTRILSTAIFYSLAQIFWDFLFSKLQWNKFMFNSFSPENWNFGQKQLGFTLPFYVTIALLASLVHTYGYSLIFKARATPGGLEIITSHLSTQKSPKISLSTLFKIFGFVIIFTVTVINFLCIENNPKVKKAELKTYLLEKSKENVTKGKESFIHKEDDLEKVLDEWKDKNSTKKDLEDKNSQLETAVKHEKDPEIQQEKKNQIFQNQQKISQIKHEINPLSTHLKNRINSKRLEIYPAEELDQYLLDSESLKQNLENKIKVENKKTNPSKKELDYMEYLQNCLEKAKNNTLKKTPIGYLEYVTNDERLWATLVYILVSSFLISQMFPKDIKVSLTVQANNRQKWSQVLKLLKEFKPVYYISNFYEQKTGEEKTVYMVNCLLTKWGYYLIQQDLKSIGVIASISELG